MKKPDNFAENKALLPYGDSVAAPAIRPDNIDDWKLRGVNKVNKQIQTKFDELKAEFEKLKGEIKKNDNNDDDDENMVKLFFQYLFFRLIKEL